MSLYYSKYSPKNPKASVILIHGFGEHSHRYSEIVISLVEKNYECHLIDFAGFGYSGGIRFISSVKMLHQNIGILL